MIDAVIVRTILRLRGCMFDFSSMGVASCTARLGHGGGEEHNCDQNGQQSCRTSSNGLFCDDHVLEPSSSIQAHYRTVARVALTSIKMGRRSLREYGDKRAVE
jgi:hypothetical protein